MDSDTSLNSPTKQIKNKQLVINTISNGALFFLNAIIGFWMTPFLLNRLGVDVYGMIPLANQVTSYLSLLTLALTGGVGRFLSIEIIKRDNKGANRVFNTTFFASIWLVLAISPFVSLFTIYLPKLMRVPQGTEIETQVLFLASFITFFLNFVQTSFLVSSWAMNRFDLRNIAIGISKIIQAVLIVILFYAFRPQVWQFSISLLFSNFVAFGIHYLIFKKLTPEIIISYKYFDKTFLKELFSFGKWIVIDQIGSLLLLNIDLLMANQLLGTRVGGEYGSLAIIPSTIRLFITSLMSVLSPKQMEYYALDKNDSLKTISTSSVKILGMFTAIIVGCICGFSRIILLTWLGNEFVNLWFLLILLVFPLLFTLPLQPLFQLQVAYKKVKVPALATLFFGVINIALIFLFTKRMHLGGEGIALACGIAIILRTTFFSSIYGAKIQNLHWAHYLREIFPGIFLFFITLGLSIGAQGFTSITNFFSLLISMASVLGIVILVSYLILFKNDLKTIKQILTS